MPETRLVVNAEGSEIRVGLLEDGQLAEYFLERERERGLVGNIYKGRVSRVLPGMQAAFVDLGPTVERKAYLYVAEILGAGDEQKLFEGYDEAGGEPAGKKRRGRRTTRRAAAARKIEDLVKEGQEITVQIVKEPVGEKGARVTGYVSLPGRHCVLMPTVDRVGVSRRISSDQERRRLRQIVEEARPKGVGFIVRTAAEGADEQEVRDDVDYLIRLWEQIRDKAGKVKAPAVLYTEFDLVLRSIRDLLREDVKEIIIDDDVQYARALKFTNAFMPRYSDRVTHYEGRTPIFDHYGIEEALRSALRRTVPLKSGGSLVIDQWEALTAIDVNTGSFVGKADLETTITKNNLEACEAVARELRLRNIGGIIVVDFVDMDKASNRKLVWEAFNKALEKDRARSNVTKISELGLVEMTRKRSRESLAHMLTERCPMCEGRGVIKSASTLAHEVLREVRRVGASVKADRILVECPPAVAAILRKEERDYVDFLEKRFQKKVEIEESDTMPPDRYKVEGRLLKIEEPSKTKGKGKAKSNRSRKAKSTSSRGKSRAKKKTASADQPADG